MWLAGKPPSLPSLWWHGAQGGAEGGREAQLAGRRGMEGVEEGRRSSPAVKHGGLRRDGGATRMSRSRE